MTMRFNISIVWMRLTTNFRFPNSITQFMELTETENKMLMLGLVQLVDMIKY